MESLEEEKTGKPNGKVVRPATNWISNESLLMKIKTTLPSCSCCSTCIEGTENLSLMVIYGILGPLIEKERTLFEAIWTKKLL